MTHPSNIDALLKIADEALSKFEIVKNGTVVDGYDSAIAAFGPTVVLSGLLPALAFYCAEKKHDNSKTDKRLVIKAIAHALQSKYDTSDHIQLFKHCLTNRSNNRAIERLTIDIVDASIALKIMVRTYKINESHEQQ